MIIAFSNYSTMVTLEMGSILKTEDEGLPSVKDMGEKEEDNLTQADTDAEEERRKRIMQEDYQVEKLRQNIKDKYGIQKEGDKAQAKKRMAALEKIKKDYNLSKSEVRDLKLDDGQDETERDTTKKKEEEKTEKRRVKKEVKKGSWC